MEIHLCKKSEIPMLLDFIKKYWNPNHVLVKRPEVLYWQYKNEEGLNFLIAIEKNEILSVLGIIPLSHFDNSLHDRKEAWGALWKVRPDCMIPGLGTILQRKATKEYSFFGGIGVSKDNISIQNALKNKVVHINHYFVINQNINDFRIAKISKGIQINSFDTEKINFLLEENNTIDAIPKLNHYYHPYKTNEYIINKYQHNPFYKYYFWICRIGEQVEAVIVVKYVEVYDRKACRIIDVLGRLDRLKGLGKAIETHISHRKDVEYADFYNSGIDIDYFISNGFVIANDYDEEIIIPNYFEPYLKKNCPLDGIIVSNNPHNYVFFKGDADQDRPNI